MNVCYCQRIHIATCITTRPGPITDSLGWFYAGLLTWKRGAFVHWHFHFGPLSNWVTGAHHAAQKKESEHAEAENSHKLSGKRGWMKTDLLSIVPTQNSESVFLLDLLFLISRLKWKAIMPKRKCLVMPIWCQLHRNCSSPLRSCVFYLFLQGNSSSAGILFVFKQQ